MANQPQQPDTALHNASFFDSQLAGFIPSEMFPPTHPSTA